MRESTVHFDFMLKYYGQVSLFKQGNFICQDHTKHGSTGQPFLMQSPLSLDLHWSLLGLSRDDGPVPLPKQCHSIFLEKWMQFEASLVVSVLTSDWNQDYRTSFRGHTHYLQRNKFELHSTLTSIARVFVKSIIKNVEVKLGNRFPW